MRNPYFELTDNKLIIYDVDAYRYQAETGIFLSKTAAEDLNLDYSWQDEPVADGELEPGQAYFNDLDVVKIADDGTRISIVHKPRWQYIFIYYWIFALCGAMGLFVMRLLKRIGAYRAVAGRVKHTVTQPKLKKMLTYLKVTTGIQCAYIVLNILSGIFLKGLLCPGIFVIAIHFVVCSVITSNRKEQNSAGDYEKAAMELWQALTIGSFIAAFLSVVAVSVL